MTRNPRPSDDALRTVRIDAEELGSLLDQLDGVPRDGKTMRRGRRRFQYREVECTVTIRQPDAGTGSSFRVPTRNISAGGMAFMHGGFVHSGSRCLVQLTNRDGTEHQIGGAVVRCRYVGAWVHEVSIKFDEAIDPAMFCEDAGQLRVLLIEDDPNAHQAIGEHVAASGGELVTVANGKGALKELATDELDCIVMDVELPEADGFALIAEIREFGYGGPIAVVTARQGADDRERAEQAGCSLWLAKPYSGELVSALFDRLSKAA